MSIKKEKIKLAKHLLSQKADPNLPILTQESVIIWGEKDRVFPVYLADQLQREREKAKVGQVNVYKGGSVSVDPSAS
ncbi:unnamed protein product [Citrullus colocynthis]|uniref:Uncharacterized protein n=1 Tax=Citrullus colocynthis TaxID=252529 RepID=A0ABP0YYU9_9ROSI